MARFVSDLFLTSTDFFSTEPQNTFLSHHVFQILIIDSFPYYSCYLRKNYSPDFTISFDDNDGPSFRQRTSNIYLSPSLVESYSLSLTVLIDFYLLLYWSRV